MNPADAAKYWPTCRDLLTLWVGRGGAAFRARGLTRGYRFGLAPVAGSTGSSQRITGGGIAVDSGSPITFGRSGFGTSRRTALEGLSPCAAAVFSFVAILMPALPASNLDDALVVVMCPACPLPRSRSAAQIRRAYPPPVLPFCAAKESNPVPIPDNAPRAPVTTTRSANRGTPQRHSIFVPNTFVGCDRRPMPHCSGEFSLIEFPGLQQDPRQPPPSRYQRFPCGRKPAMAAL